MKKIFAAAVMLASCCVTAAMGEIRTMYCYISARQEVPTNASPAQGCGMFIVDTDANTMTYRITRWGLTSAETAAHIHGFSDPGVNSGVQHPLPAGDLKVGVWNFTEAQESAILMGRCYVNIHTANFPGGEIRGQIMDAVAELDGGQEVPANGSTARGFGVVDLDTTTNTARIFVGLNGVVGETAAHIHGVSRQGVNSGVLFALPVGNFKAVTWTYPESVENDLLSGLCYFNVHTAAFPGGEIRGQIVSSVNVMDRNQEVPPSNTSSAGCILCGLDRANDVMTYDMRINLVGSVQTAAHIHGFAPVGVNAGVVQNIGVGNRMLGTYAYAPALEPQIENDLTYANVHTNIFPGGEIRGQIFFAPFPPPPCPWRAAGSCAADFDGDGDFDSDDIVRFFANWEAGDNCADADNDGDADSDDVIEFFSKWDGGSC